MTDCYCCSNNIIHASRLHNNASLVAAVNRSLFWQNGTASRGRQTGKSVLFNKPNISVIFHALTTNDVQTADRPFCRSDLDGDSLARRSCWSRVARQRLIRLQAAVSAAVAARRLKRGSGLPLVLRGIGTDSIGCGLARYFPSDHSHRFLYERSTLLLGCYAESFSLRRWRDWTPNKT